MLRGNKRKVNEWKKEKSKRNKDMKMERIKIRKGGNKVQFKGNEEYEDDRRRNNKSKGFRR